MAIEFSPPVLTSTGAVQWTLTLEGDYPELTRDDFSVEFNGTVDGVLRVDMPLPDAPFRLTGTGASRTFLALPPHNAHGTLHVYYCLLYTSPSPRD